MTLQLHDTSNRATGSSFTNLSFFERAFAAELFRVLRSVLSTSPRLHHRMECRTHQHGVILGSQHSKGAQRHGRVMAGETLGSQSWVSCKTGIDNCLMFTHPSLKSLWGLSTIEASVALGMIRELRYHGHDTGTS